MEAIFFIFYLLENARWFNEIDISFAAEQRIILEINIA